MSWNVLCPSCGGVLDANTSLRSVRSEDYYCAFCNLKNEPTLDDMVEVTFTVNPRARRIAAHSPDKLPIWEYAPADLLGLGRRPARRRLRLVPPEDHAGYRRAAGRREGASCRCSFQPSFIIVFEPVTHAAQFLEVKGEPTEERQGRRPWSTTTCARRRAPSSCGPGRYACRWRTAPPPACCRASGSPATNFTTCVGRRRPFLTAKRLLTNQTFRDIYRTDTLDVDQRLKITSLTFLFTDLKGSTELYERVGDLVAFDLVREHFRILNDIVAADGGAVVKTIGDAVMATFLTPDHALAAALRMRDAMRTLNATHGREDLLLKIGIHEGPCLAVNAERPPGLFRPDGEHRLARPGPGDLALDPGDRHRSSRIRAASACWMAMARPRCRTASRCAASPRRSQSTKSPELPAAQAASWPPR